MNDNYQPTETWAKKADGSWYLLSEAIEVTQFMVGSGILIVFDEEKNVLLIDQDLIAMSIHKIKKDDRLIKYPRLLFATWAIIQTGGYDHDDEIEEECFANYLIDLFQPKFERFHRPSTGRTKSYPVPFHNSISKNWLVRPYINIARDLSDGEITPAHWEKKPDGNWFLLSEVDKKELSFYDDECGIVVVFDIDRCVLAITIGDLPGTILRLQVNPILKGSSKNLYVTWERFFTPFDINGNLKYYGNYLTDVYKPKYVDKLCADAEYYSKMQLPFPPRS